MIDRRFLLRAGAAGLALAGLRAAIGQPLPAVAHALVPDPNKLFDLPEGFTYTVISEMGQRMADGLPTPGRFDGMGAFAGPGGRTILVRNHEFWPYNGNGPFGAKNELLTPAIQAKMFNPSTGPVAKGGTTTVLLNADNSAAERTHLSLAGTLRNCAGGTTPWGSWLTCEEPKRSFVNKLADGHGWVFEVPSRATDLIQAVPLRAMGRFNHEAAVVDPKTGIVYQTEDQKNGLFYRFLPAQPGKLAKGGRLQALVVDGIPNSANRDGAWKLGAAHPVRWIDLDGVDAPDDDLRDRGGAKGATRFVRGEGLAIGDDGVIWFTCTEGGANEKGQVFRYKPSAAEGKAGEKDAAAEISLFIEPNDRALLDMPDNLCVAPWGDLVICEDGEGTVKYLRLVAPDGRIRTIGRNAHPDNAELAGVCFSPDGGTMFVNIYAPGYTLAIKGPWTKLAA
ncbi:alkaline phosphatase PhoX [Sphingoaurantiacus capsulatus]|uniref:Alkaline phosphatase PhoX n=1 Tax=Sphingoaurantiacus capsulatus TaxID=1771310 RepID=A0ABV7XE73_9SPHN